MRGMNGMDHSGIACMDAAMQSHPASETNNPLVGMQTMTPTHKLDDPGIGLRDKAQGGVDHYDPEQTQQEQAPAPALKTHTQADGKEHLMTAKRKGARVAMLVALFMASAVHSADALTIDVNRDANCGCCKKWISHLEANGLKVIDHV